MDKRKLEILAELYGTAAQKAAVTDEQMCVLWTNQPDFFKDFFPGALFERPEPKAEFALRLPIETDTMCILFQSGEPYTARVLPVSEGGAVGGYLIEAVTMTEFDLLAMRLDTNVVQDRQRQIAGIRTAVSEIVATNAMLYEALVQQGQFELVEMVKNQSASCYKALSYSSNLSELLKYSMGVFKPVRSNASVYLADIVGTCAHFLRDLNVEITRQIEPDIHLELDYDRFTAAVMNLIINAVQNNISEKKTVQITLRRSRSEIIFSIEDNGIGIPPENIPKLFTPYALTEKFSEKTGLGLPLCNMFAEKFGAAITVSSKLDMGTQIFMRFPADDDPTIPASLESPSKAYITERFSPLYLYLSKVIKIKIV
ncbi:MAG: HAMP domain-containing sensor histidine kinase [Oscillospiraceae bacterium]